DSGSGSDPFLWTVSAGVRGIACDRSSCLQESQGACRSVGPDAEAYDGEGSGRCHSRSPPGFLAAAPGAGDIGIAGEPGTDSLALDYRRRTAFSGAGVLP